jgi:hypothetical protein
VGLRLLLRVETFFVKASDDVCENLVDTLIPVDIEDEAASTVERQEGLRFEHEHLEPVRHDVFPVVNATLLTAANEQPPRELRNRDVQVHNCLQFNGPDLSCGAVRGLRLRKVPWEAVKHVATQAACRNEWPGQHLKYHIVRHQIASANVFDRLFSDFSTSSNLLAQELSTREVHNSVMVGKLLCLGSFACAGGSH